MSFTEIQLIDKLKKINHLNELYSRHDNSLMKIFEKV